MVSTNLTPWKPGQTGNPKGRPKGAKSLKTRLTELLESKIAYTDISKKPKDMTVADAIAIALIQKAIYTGDIKAIEMIKNEVEGNQPKELELTDQQKTIVQRAFARISEMKDVTK